jgi:hypothetical protein
MADRITASQVIAQVEYGEPPIQKVSHLLAQVERWDVPTYMKVDQVLAQVEVTPPPPQFRVTGVLAQIEFEPPPPPAGPRTPIALVILVMDWCGRTFGVDPCLATGEPCYNTYPTCKYKSAYLKESKDYRFTSRDAILPFSLVRPYVVSIKPLPTEIKTSLTVSGRVTVEFDDEPDGDVGVDPYVRSRGAFPSIPGTYWKKFLVRNRNYKGREIRIFDGWPGMEQSEYVERWRGRIENATYKRGHLSLEAVDYLKDLAKVEVPPKLDVKLAAAMNTTQTSLTVTGTEVTGLDAPSGHIRIGEEILAYTGIDTVTGIVTGVSRAQFGSVAEEHAVNDKVQKVKHYPLQNAFDMMKSMLIDDGGIPAEKVDEAAFGYWKTYPETDLDIGGIPVHEPTKLDKLFFEVVKLMDCKVWYSESLKITIARNLVNDPLRTYHALSDDANIVLGSASIDHNEKSRISRCYLYWSKILLGKPDDVSSYNRVDIAVDADAESPNDYGEAIEEKIFCRWLHTGNYVEEEVAAFAKNLAMRKVWRNRDASPIVKVEVESKDAGMKTGEWVQLSTDELVDQHGRSLSGIAFQIVRRERKGDSILLSLLRGAPRMVRIGYIGPDTLPDWASATDADKVYGYICADDGTLPTDEEGYSIM